MIITSIEQQKRNDKRYSVHIDYKFAFGIDAIDLLYYKLKEEDAITEEQLAHIIEHVVFTKAKEKAFRYLGFKAVTERELAGKLSKEEFTQEVIEKVMEVLKRYDYINDEKYALSYVRDRVNLKEHGKIRIVYELKQKGVAEPYINNAFAHIEEEGYNPLQKALNALEKKCKTATLDLKEKRRLYGYLLRKGYTPDVINSALLELEGRLS